MPKPQLQDGLETTIVCPACQLNPPRLIVKTNRRNQGQFLGCPNWPECHHTQPIPEHMILQATGQQPLF
jgi:ssDNA-binding Zn-finger/Zn-ribbon topoisomerase 1